MSIYLYDLERNLTVDLYKTVVNSPSPSVV
jgi:hypothetical protein